MNDSQFSKITDDIYIKYCKDQTPYVMQEVHYHDCYEIIFFLSNNISYFVKDNIYNIQKNDLVFIAPFDLHRVIDAGCTIYERIVINFRKEYFDEALIDSGILNFYNLNRNKVSIINEKIRNLFYEISNEENTVDQFSTLRTKLLMTDLLILLNREVKNSTIQLDFDANINNQKVLSIISYINEHYMEDISLTLLSKYFYCSPYYLGHLFKNTTGFTIIEYLNKRRISAAQQLLMNNKYNISSISEMVGFNNPTSFSRTFKSIIGVSPMEYKRQYKYVK